MRHQPFPFWTWGKQAATPPRPHRGKWITWREEAIRLRGDCRHFKAANLNRAIARSKDADFMIRFLHPRRLRVIA